jgi:hypothetical protein
VGCKCAQRRAERAARLQAQREARQLQELADLQVSDQDLAAALDDSSQEPSTQPG